jgi:hypothetical protein
VFGRPFAAVAYQQLLKEWALGRLLGSGSGNRSWYQPDRAACKAIFRLLTERMNEIIRRLTEELNRLLTPGSLEEGNCVSLERVSASKEGNRRTLWQLARRLAQVLAGREEQPRFSCHYLWMALARHPYGAQYSLESA